MVGDPPVLEALLVDLDGTLLGVSMGDFFPRMVRSMREAFGGLIPEQRALDALRQGLEAILGGGDPEVGLLDTFLEVFTRVSGLTREESWETFMRFYRGPFREMGAFTEPLDGARELLRAAQETGLPVALATNPIFPREAILTRVEWAGLDPADFAAVTTIESMHWCKPRREYYLETAALLGVSPDACLMVGNDRHLDLSAAGAGMTTFLVENRYITGAKPANAPDYEGTLRGLVALLPTLTR